MLARFLNADLELWHTRPISSLVKSLQPEMYVLYSGCECMLSGRQPKGPGYFARLELSDLEPRPKAEWVAEAIASVISNLPEPKLKLWRELRVRRLSFGYDAVANSWGQSALLSPRVARACLSVQLEMEVCIYPVDQKSKQSEST